MVKIESISKYFGDKKAVDEVSFEVAAGENLILLGKSGCGKTTTLKLINRLVKLDSGTITINGKNIEKENIELLRRNIGYVMQHGGLFPHYTVTQNISIVPQLLNWDKDKINSRIDELMNKLHLAKETLNMFPHQLSGGQQQRVGLARALIADTPLLLMDEPFGALDNVTRTEIQKEFKALEEFKNKTIVMVTHDVQEAFELGDRIALMDQGKIIQIGTPKDLLYHPVSEFAKQFFEGERLALEFKLVLISDLWDGLETVANYPEKSLPSTLNMWEAMEILRKSKNLWIYFTDTNHQTKKASFESLALAFSLYQKAEGNERK